MFEINADRNGGVAYQYDEVVRNKDDRKKMEAGDCECCRDVRIVEFPHNCEPLLLIIRAPFLFSIVLYRYRTITPT